jgi:hypothetical protein
MKIEIEIEGQQAIQATEELLNIEGIEGNYETIDEVEREPILTTIATIVGIVGGTITLAKEIYEWYQKYRRSKGAKIEKVLIVSPNGRRLLLKDATVEQIQEILED